MILETRLYLLKMEIILHLNLMCRANHKFKLIRILSAVINKKMETTKTFSNTIKKKQMLVKVKMKFKMFRIQNLSLLIIILRMTKTTSF
jgi:hypothetical protein